MSANQPDARIPELDGIRGIAIGMVLFAHFFGVMTITRPGSLLAYSLVPFRLTWTGVDLFFVLSGFLIGGILLDARQSSNYFRVFYTRRFFRIVPIYAVLLLTVYFADYLWQIHFLRGFDEVFQGRLPWLPHVVFLQNFAMVTRNSMGSFPLGVTWSLAIEEQFYLTLPLLIRFLSRRALLFVIFLGIALSPILRTAFHHFWPDNFPAWYTLMPCRADTLLLGVLGAVAVRDTFWKEWLVVRRKPLLLCILLLLSGTAFFGWRAPSHHSALMATAGFTWLALTYFSILLYGVLFKDSVLSRCLRWGWLRGLGVIAYGTYLFHEFFLGLFFGRIPWVRSWRDLAVSVVALSFTLFFCRVSWLYFEKPLVKLGHRWRYQYEGPTQPVADPVPLQVSIR